MASAAVASDAKIDGRAAAERKKLKPFQPECRILIYHVAKKSNIGTILRSAVALGVREIVVVGKGGKLQTFGNKGTVQYVKFSNFENLAAAVAYLKADGFSIVGVEISDTALDVASHPFTGNTCFMFGNEGQGLIDKAIAVCDRLVYIKQMGCGTASLNVAVAAGIVLHHFATWAKYPETARAGQKFVLADASEVNPHIANSLKRSRPSEDSSVPDNTADAASQRVVVPKIETLPSAEPLAPVDAMDTVSVTAV